MTTMVFRCDSGEKNQFMLAAERLELDGSFLLRQEQKSMSICPE